MTISHLMARKRNEAPEYGIWRAMKARCLNPNVAAWNGYGGRGIKVCDRWMKFENFFKDMGIRPPGMTLDRIDNNGNYDPINCRWTSKKHQAINRRNTIFISINGNSKTLEEWSLISKISVRAIYDRLRLGWKPKDAVFQSICPGKPCKYRLSESQYKFGQDGQGLLVA